MASAAGYSERLSECSNKGQLNLRDAPDPPVAVLGKVRALAAMIRASPHTVVHSGAGLSTSAGIADFRGPTGVWTNESKNESVNPAAAAAAAANPHAQPVSFATAAPTLAHMAVVALHRAKLVHYVISQNVDALHLRSGLPRAALSELHGNLFVEVCAACGKEHLRDHETASVGFQPVAGRVCTCGGTLTDKALDWEDPLPQPDLARAEDHARRAALSIVVGSSCQMVPARNLPFRSRALAPKTALVNLSKTKLDGRFSIAIRAGCDTVFALLLDELHIPLPGYRRTTVLHLRVDRDPRADGALHCRVWSAANADERGRIGPLASVAFSLNAASSSSPPPLPHTITGPPYSHCLPALPELAGASTVVSATFLFCGDPVLHCILTCAPNSETSQEVVIANHDYSAQAATLVREARERARGTKRAAAAGDAAVWFARASKRRGYVRCVACDVDVPAAQKARHVLGCAAIAAAAEKEAEVRMEENIAAE
jgi:NAD+-dependent protein deacetylase sirtuin 6